MKLQFIAPILFAGVFWIIPGIHSSHAHSEEYGHFHHFYYPTSVDINKDNKPEEPLSVVNNNYNNLNVLQARITVISQPHSLTFISHAKPLAPEVPESPYWRQRCPAPPANTITLSRSVLRRLMAQTDARPGQWEERGYVPYTNHTHKASNSEIRSPYTANHGRPFGIREADDDLRR